MMQTWISVTLWTGTKAGTWDATNQPYIFKGFQPHLRTEAVALRRSAVDWMAPCVLKMSAKV